MMPFREISDGTDGKEAHGAKLISLDRPQAAGYSAPLPVTDNKYESEVNF